MPHVTDFAKKPEAGDTMDLYPPNSWRIGGNELSVGQRCYKIGEWRGSLALMECGAYFKWTEVAGFLL